MLRHDSPSPDTTGRRAVSVDRESPVMNAEIRDYSEAGARRHGLAGNGTLLNLDRAEFEANFNRNFFEVQHQLADHPLFQIPRLLELADEMTKKWPKDIYFDAGVDDIGQRWSGAPADITVEDLMRRIETSKAWIDFKSAERSKEYGKVLNTIICDILKISGRQLEKNMRRKQMAIFVTSPNRISTYHIDSEVNFLLQIRGEKEISLFDRKDREVLPEVEIERSWTVDVNAAVYKPHLQDRATVFKLRPGNGVHIPVNSPHWVKNGNNISVSAAILYHSWDSAYYNLYSTNYYLRRMGLNPTPPFQSKLLDALKQPVGAAIQAYRTARFGNLRNIGPNADGIPDRTPDDAF